MQAVHAGEGGRECGQHGFIGAEERNGLRVDALFCVRRLHEPRHDHFGRVVADGDVVREVLGDLVALLLPLQGAHRLVTVKLQPRPLGRVLARKARNLFHGGGDDAFRGVELALGGLQDFERHYFGLLHRAAKITIGFEDARLPLHLILGVGGDLEIERLDLVEPRGDVAACHLHPDVRDPLHGADLSVRILIDERPRVVADGIKRRRDPAITLRDGHAGDFGADDVVELGGFVEGAGDRGDARLVKVGDLLQEGDDRRRLGVLRCNPEGPKLPHGLVEILQGGRALRRLVHGLLPLSQGWQARPCPAIT